MKFILSLILLFFGLGVNQLTRPIQAFAQTIDQNFQTKLVTTYNVSSLGKTLVVHNFTLTNNSPTHYISQYALQTNYTGLANVRATNENSPLTPHVVETNDQTSIALDFPNKIVGEGQSRQFTISYESDLFAQVAGQVLEISIPKITGPNSYQERTVILEIPAQYGQATSIDPTPDSIRQQATTQRLTFEKIGENSINAFFGDKQIFDLSLRYNLINSGSSEAITEVALPPDTPWQKLHYRSIDPAPIKIHDDSDGNWLATYQLNPGEEKTVYVDATAQLSLDPNPSIQQTPPLPQHTQPSTYWPSTNTQLQQIATEFPSIEDLYRYVLDTLDYTEQDLSVLRPRLGGDGALGDPNNAVCQEYTDLFIALSRAQQVPARRLTGFAYASNNQIRPLSLAGDILHAWPEYYDVTTQQWKQVDPTWEDTTGGVDYFNHFDLNHIVFAINGVSDTSPHPVGAYKTDQLDSQDVSVNLGNIFPKVVPNFIFEIRPKKLSFISIPGFYELEIYNNTGQAWYDVNVKLSSTSPDVNTYWIDEKPLISILPTETIKKTFFITTTFATPHKTQIQTQIDIPNELTSITQPDQNLTAFPTYGLEVQRFGELNLILGSCLVLLALSIGSLLVLKQRR